MQKFVKYILIAVGVLLLVGVLFAVGMYATKSMKEASQKNAVALIDKASLANNNDASKVQSELIVAYNKERSKEIKYSYAMALGNSLKESDPKAALDWYKKSATFKEDSYTYLNLGLAARKAGDKDEAAKAFRKTLIYMKQEDRNEEETLTVKDLLREMEK